MTCRTALPYILRITASGALFTGSLITLLTSEKSSPFLYASLYSSSIYTISNVIEAGKELTRRNAIIEPLSTLESVSIDSFEKKLTISRISTHHI